MFEPATPQPDGSAATPARLNFLQRLESIAIRPAAREYYVRWAETWIKAHGNRSPEATSAYFDALGRSTHLADWQFRQAVDAARILACEVLALPWAAAFDWQGLSDQAKSLEPSHRTHGREAIQVRAVLPPPPPPDPANPLPETNAEVERIVDALRRAIRLGGLAFATEQTYVHWCVRFTRFCLIRLRQSTDEAIRAYWESNEDSFVTALRRKFSYILVTPAFAADTTEPDEAKAARLAEARRMAQHASAIKVENFLARLDEQPATSLEALANDKDFDWVVKTTGLCDRDQAPADLVLPLRGSSRSGTATDILFGDGEPFDPSNKLASPIPVGDGQWLIVRLDEEEKARGKTFIEAMDEARARYVSEKAAHAMAASANEAATRIKASLSAGKSFATAAREAGRFEIKRFNSLVSGYRPDATEPANFFKAARDTEPGAIAGPVFGVDRCFIIHITGRVALPVDNAEDRLDAAMKLRIQEHQSTAFINWIATRTKAAKVERLINR
jgi:hypothetical protein